MDRDKRKVAGWRRVRSVPICCLLAIDENFHPRLHQAYIGVTFFSANIDQAQQPRCISQGCASTVTSLPVDFESRWEANSAYPQDWCCWSAAAAATTAAGSETHAPVRCGASLGARPSISAVVCSPPAGTAGALAWDSSAVDAAAAVVRGTVEPAVGAGTAALTLERAGTRAP